MFRKLFSSSRSPPNHFSPRVILTPDEIRKECNRFRVLVIGKANAGKTTILRKICNVDSGVQPIILDQKGEVIEDALGEGKSQEVLRPSELVRVNI